jgi:hypothetical protein
MFTGAMSFPGMRYEHLKSRIELLRFLRKPPVSQACSNVALRPPGIATTVVVWL